MAIFRKKSDDSSPKEAPKEFKPDPAKARKWFDHAKSMADSHQYASALVYYANGLKFDPDSITIGSLILLKPRASTTSDKELSEKATSPRTLSELNSLDFTVG